MDLLSAGRNMEGILKCPFVKCRCVCQLCSFIICQCKAAQIRATHHLNMIVLLILSVFHFDNQILRLNIVSFQKSSGGSTGQGCHFIRRQIHCHFLSGSHVCESGCDLCILRIIPQLWSDKYHIGALRHPQGIFPHTLRCFRQFITVASGTVLHKYHTFQHRLLYGHKYPAGGSISSSLYCNDGCAAFALRCCHCGCLSILGYLHYICVIGTPDNIRLFCGILRQERYRQGLTFPGLHHQTCFAETDPLHHNLSCLAAHRRLHGLWKDGRNDKEQCQQPC